MPKHNQNHLFRLTTLTLLTTAAAFAQAAAPPAAAKSAADEKFPAPEAVEKISKTQHSFDAAGQKFSYTALAGTLLLKKEEGKPRASVFFVSYTRDNAGDASKRPVTFIFNGGPGSSSVWLHMGAFGPKRVEMGPDGTQPTPPYSLV